MPGIWHYEFMLPLRFVCFVDKRSFCNSGSEDEQSSAGERSFTARQELAPKVDALLNLSARTDEARPTMRSVPFHLPQPRSSKRNVLFHSRMSYHPF
jgi:hypothetical protein